MRCRASRCRRRACLPLVIYTKLTRLQAGNSMVTKKNTDPLDPRACERVFMLRLFNNFLLLMVIALSFRQLLVE